MSKSIWGAIWKKRPSCTNSCSININCAETRSTAGGTSTDQEAGSLQHNNMGGVTKYLMPVVSKAFCSSSQTVLLVRKRPRNVNGGGLVVINAHDQQVIFTVDGCGIIGVKGEVIVKDGDDNSILIIRRKGCLVQALSVNNYWKGQLMDYGAPTKMVFSLREPKLELFVKSTMKICVEPKGRNKGWDLEVRGSFLDRACNISDRKGNTLVQIGAKETAPAPATRDVYQVVVQPGLDQAFVVGVIAVLDYINGESTRC